MMRSALTFCILLCLWKTGDTLSLGSCSCDLQRRNILSSPAGALLSIAICCGGRSSPANAGDNGFDEIQSTMTGVQYRDDRIGQGPLVEGKDVLVMHLQGIRRDGSVFVDTRQQGNKQPILHQLGTVVDFDVFGGDSSRRPLVTLGVEDGIRGMRYGGIRRMTVPSPLGYGSAGVSRYDAFKMGLLKPVPRDELLRYEVELLRCQEVSFATDGDNSTEFKAQACCTEPNYPCNTSLEQSD